MTAHEGTLGFTGQLAHAAAELPVPPLLHSDAIARAWVDTVGVAVAAAKEKGLRALQTAVLGDTLPGAWVGGQSVRADDAALLNGTAAHFLDYDDGSASTPLHPSAVLVPAIMAAGIGDSPLSFDRFAEAYNIGAATLRIVAEALPNGEHYARGWHATATVGRLSAVAAIGRYRRVSPDIMMNALGMVSSMAGGSRANFGTMTKPMHAGLAARDALHAVDWSIAGVTASRRELEASAGFFNRFGNAEVFAGFADGVGERLERWLQEWPNDWALKRYPSCYGTHRAIDAARELRQRVPVEDVASIAVEVYREGTAPLILRRPQTGMEAKFNLQYCVALAWLHGDVTLQDFTPARFEAEDRVREFADRITLHEVDGDGEFAHVTVTHRNGGLLSRSVTIARGDYRDPLDADELRAKVQSCCDFAGITVASAHTLFAAAEGIPGDTDLLELAHALHVEEA